MSCQRQTSDRIGIDERTDNQTVLSISSCLVYGALNDHQLRQSEWDHQPIVAELQRFRESFAFEFKLQLAPTVLRIDSAYATRYGHVIAGHNQFGLIREIAFNERLLRTRLGKGEIYQILGTELQELLHAWQFDHGNRGHRNHLNRESRSKAKLLGLVVDKRGSTEFAPESPFLAVLEKHGVHVPPTNTSH